MLEGMISLFFILASRWAHFLCLLGSFRRLRNYLSASLALEGRTRVIEPEFKSNSTDVNIECSLAFSVPIFGVVVKDRNRVRILFSTNQSFRRERSGVKPRSYSRRITTLQYVFSSSDVVTCLQS